MNIQIAGLRLRIPVMGLIAYCVALLLLSSLGIWQLNRADEKRKFLEQQQAMIVQERVILNKMLIDQVVPQRYRQVSVQGLYDMSHQLLIDNQVLHGKPGFFVMTPLLIDGANKTVLVNRGWIPLGKSRNEIPDLTINQIRMDIQGRVDAFPVVGVKLAGGDDVGDTWPAIVQSIDKEKLSRVLGVEVLNFQVQLDPDENEGFNRDWKIMVAIPPEKHVAYAVQWFSLAVTLTILCLWMASKKQSK